jgi:ATP-dependent 26S proteasome regulatory subunit
VSEVTAQNDATRSLHAKIDELAENNQKLASTLREAREQITGLKNEIDKLSAPPNGYASYLGPAGNGLVNVSVNGRKMRVEISPSIAISELKPGQEVILNESMNVVVAGEFETHGEMAKFHELLPDGDRAIVIGRSDEERIVNLAQPLIGIELRVGDSLLYDTKTGFAYELIHKTEVEELVLEEVPDINYSDIGGLGPQIEQIRDAVELPFLHRDLYKTYELKAPKGILLYGPPGCGKTLIAKAVANSLAKKVYALLPPDLRRRVVLYEGSSEKMAALDRLSDEKSNVIVMGPSLLEGIDLKDDLSRLQIFLKVPYPSLGSNFVKEKMNFYPMWYKWAAEIAIEQGVGRSVRSMDDYCVTYFLDGCLQDLLREPMAFNATFRERIQIIDTI